MKHHLLTSFDLVYYQKLLVPCFLVVRSSRVSCMHRKLAQYDLLIQKLHILNQAEGRQGRSCIRSEQCASSRLLSLTAADARCFMEES